MPINVMWKNEEKTMLGFMYEGKWDLNDFYQANQQGNSMLDSVNYPVALVMDVQGSRMIPNGFIAALSNTSKKIHPNAGIVVMVGVNVFARAFVDIFRKIYPQKDGEKTIHFTANYTEVQALMDRNLIKKLAT